MTDLTRRQTLGLAGLAGAAAILPAAAWAEAEEHLFTWPLGVQLYSVNAELDRDFAGTLAQLAALGYRQCEAAGLHGQTPAGFRAAIAAAGLSCPSAHYSMGDLQKDPAGSIATVRDMGAQWLVCSSPKPDRPLTPGEPWIPGIMHAMTADAWRKNADWLNRLGHMAHAAGLGFAYHDHPVDFAVYDGLHPYDLFLRSTDPALVKMELDVAWAVAGGADPVALMRAHPGRFVFLHVKGLLHRPPAGQVDTDFATTEVGHGVIDWPAVFRAAHAAGVRGCFVEQEPPYRRPIFESLAMCRTYLESI